MKTNVFFFRLRYSLWLQRECDAIFSKFTFSFKVNYYLLSHRILFYRYIHILFSLQLYICMYIRQTVGAGRIHLHNYRASLVDCSAALLENEYFRVLAYVNLYSNTSTIIIKNTYVNIVPNIIQCWLIKEHKYILYHTVLKICIWEH